MFTLPDIHDIVAASLAEDLGVSVGRFGTDVPPDRRLLAHDATTSSVIAPGGTLSGRIVAREELVVAGLPVAAAVFETLARAADVPDGIDIFPLVAEGSRVDAGTPLAEVCGLAEIVLAGERTALDFLMVLSGIATEAKRWQEAAGERLAVVDTRKTYPGLRALSKYATLVGGATNHRKNLSDMVLVKDNHLQRVSIAEAVAHARTARPGLAIEVEADTIEQALEAVTAGADLVLLDNMDDETLAEAVEAIHTASRGREARILIEASGGVTLDRVAALRRIGVDRVSTSAITFAAPLDVALDADWTD